MGEVGLEPAGIIEFGIPTVWNLGSTLISTGTAAGTAAWRPGEEGGAAQCIEAGVYPAPRHFIPKALGTTPLHDFL